MRVGLRADAAVSPNGMSSAESAMRSAFADCLSSIGLPGEEAATFEPLIIEPYEPSPSATVPSAAAAAATAARASVEPPPSPLTPPTDTPSPSASQPSLTTACISSGAAIVPKPPPGSALKRFASSRRNLVRQASQVGSGGAAATAAATAAAGGDGSGDGGTGGTGEAGGGGGGSGGSAALPAAPRTPLPVATDVPVIPPSPALSYGEVPVVVFDPSAIPALSTAAAAGIADGKSTTSSFLDPSKPAVRRLLPPLLRASQVLQDSAAADVSPTGLDDSGQAGCSSPFSAIGYGSSAASPAGGGTAGGASGAGLNGWAELQEALPAATEPMAVPLLCVDVYDMASPRVAGRRALPPMDPLRTSAAALSLNAASTSDATAAEVELSEELAATPSEPSQQPAGHAAAAASASSRRCPPTRTLPPWDAEAPMPIREHRTWAEGANEAGDCPPTEYRSVTSTGYAGFTSGGHGGVMHRTASFHAVGGGGGGGGGGSSSGYVGTAPVSLRAWGAVMPPDVSLMGLSSGGGGGGGAAGNGGSGVVAAGRDTTGPHSRANSLSMGSTRTAPAPALAALPRIVDRGGVERRQTMTN